MITQIDAPDVALRCDGCGEVWYFTADEPLHESERDEFIEDCLEVLEDTHDPACACVHTRHGVPAAPGYFTHAQ